MRKIFIILLTLFSTSLFATNYYVKNGGNDSNTGLSDAQAWVSLTKIASFAASPGDCIYFKCGDTWRGDFGTVSGSTSGYVTYGAYGTGNKPLILGSVELNGGWTNISGNIWQNSNASLTRQVGNLIFNNETSCGTKVWGNEELVSQGQFWYDWTNDRIRLYSTSNPVVYYTDIEAALAGNPGSGYYGENSNVGTRVYVRIENLDFRYAGNGWCFGETHHIQVVSCDFSFDGGCEISQGSETRLGGGIGTWASSYNWLIEKCMIDNEYDAGITVQTTIGTSNIHDMIIRNNIISNCEYNFEFWSPNTVTMSNIYFENNTCLNSGGGWAHFQRDSGERGYSLNMGNIALSAATVYIRNNIFYEATETLINTNHYYNIGNSTIVMDYNIFFTANDHVGWDNSDDIYYTLAQWKTATGKETHSIYNDPLLTLDYKLQVGSPAIDVGTTTAQVTDDYWGTSRPLNGIYDMGVHEYGYEPLPPVATGLIKILQGSTWVFVKSGNKLVRKQ